MATNLYGKSCTPNTGGILDFYTKGEINQLLAAKAGVSSTYTRVYLDGQLSSLGNNISSLAASAIDESELETSLSALRVEIENDVAATYATLANTYTQSEVDSLISSVDLDPDTLLRRVPTTTATNTVSPGTNDVISLTLRGSSVNPIVQRWLDDSGDVIGYVSNDGTTTFEGKLTIGRLVSTGSVSLDVRTNAVIHGDLQVLGTTTTINATTVDTTDKVINLSTGATTPSQADGSGISVSGALASILYNNSSDSWDFNKALSTVDGTSASPAYSFTSEPTTGIYLSGPGSLALTAANAVEIGAAAGAPVTFKIGSTEAARIDSSSRFLLGTSSATAGGSFLQIQGAPGTATDPGAITLRRGETAANITAGEVIGQLLFQSSDGGGFGSIQIAADATAGASDFPGRLVFSVTADGSASPTEAMRINSSRAIGFNGANFGTSGQVLVSNGSTAPPTWQSVNTPVFGWNHTNDAYGLYLPGTSISTGSLSGTIDIDVQSRLRRCVINDSGVVQYYLDADDSTLKAGDWLRIVETESLATPYTGAPAAEATNSLLRVGVPAWAAGTFTRGQRVTHNGSLWECIAASTTATPAAGTVASDLTGTDGQVVVEVPAFSVRYGFLNGIHTREVRLGCSDDLIAQGFRPHPSFIKTDGTYKAAFYIGAYQVTGTSPATTVSGASNRVSMTRAMQRAASAARGTGWHVLSYLEYAAIQTLLVTEYRDHNSQKVVGNGAQEGNVYVVNTGLSNTRGNRSGNAYTVGGANTDYMSYRGIENLYGRAWQWVDGFNVYERVVYLTNNQSVFADNTSVGYKFYAQVPSGSSSYQKEIFPLPDVFLPSVVTGASSTSYLGDVMWTSTGWRVALVGGSSGNGTPVGAFTLGLGNASGAAAANIGSRLSYAQN